MPSFLRFRQALPGEVNITFAGAEANVAVSLCLLGLPVRFVTALPENDIVEACIAGLRALKVDTRFVLRGRPGRLGAYYVENGANQRAGGIIYDREFSSIALTPPEAYDWDAIFKDARAFHISGITPALSKNAADAAVCAVQKAHAAGLTVSCDLNFRKKLWNWAPGLPPKELARTVMARLMPSVDLLIGNEEDADDVLNIKAGETDVRSGKLETEKYPGVARQIVQRYPNVSRVAFTLRESISASHNNWGAVLYNAKTDSASFAPLRNGSYEPYQIHHIVDRIGGGDSFSAALIYALLDPELSKNDRDCAAFAAAASCLCHSVYGDFNFVTKDEITALMKGNASGRVNR
jgi:2-dehydro-3-deoxygluconokinase